MARWLLLIHQIPPKPDYFRVKVRRRLQRLGAAPLKNTVYLLPSSEEALEDFQWLAQEIRRDGGDALVAEADFVAGITNEEIEAMLHDQRPAPAPPAVTGSDRIGTGRTWVTRIGVKVDRIASAWLIRTRIDTDATFRFVPQRDFRPAAGELRFDMFEGEFTHEGESCTFEVLLDRFDLTGDDALAAIGEIVHDIDCKDGRFGRPETAGIGAMIDGIAQPGVPDAVRLERGGAVFSDLYRALRARNEAGRNR